MSLLSLVLESTQYLLVQTASTLVRVTPKYTIGWREKNVLRLNDKPSHLWWAALEFENKVRTRTD